MANPLKQLFGALRNLVDKLVGRRTVVKEVEVIKEVPIIREVIKEVEVPVEKIVEKKVYVNRPKWEWTKGKSWKKWNKKNDDCDDKD
jgi:hypothetical protein